MIHLRSVAAIAAMRMPDTGSARSANGGVLLTGAGAAAGFAALCRAIAPRTSCSKISATHAPASDSDTIHSAAKR